MLRFFARFVGFWFVAGAVVLAVVDGAKSLAASAFVTTSVVETLRFLSGNGGGASAPAAEPVSARWPLDLAIAWFLSAPTVAVLAIAGVALLVLGAKKRRPQLSREFAA